MEGDLDSSAFPKYSGQRQIRGGGHRWFGSLRKRDVAVTVGSTLVLGNMPGMVEMAALVADSASTCRGASMDGDAFAIHLEGLAIAVPKAEDVMRNKKGRTKAEAATKDDKADEPKQQRVAKAVKNHLPKKSRRRAVAPKVEKAVVEELATSRRKKTSGAQTEHAAAKEHAALQPGVPPAARDDVNVERQGEAHCDPQDDVDEDIDVVSSVAEPLSDMNSYNVLDDLPHNIRVCIPSNDFPSAVLPNSPYYGF